MTPRDSILARFTRDLTEEARAGRLDPIRCREEEISRVIDILLRQGKNNPALVGPSGVGKTAIAEGLAQRVAAGGVPLALRGVRILAVDHVSLLAGTTYRGQYEERIRSIVDETSTAGDVVLFIDELHNLIGQGTALGAAMDAGNMLKPALVRGDFRVVGATTSDEYERWVCSDPALERRFQKIDVRELGVPETMEILQARRSRLEQHHHVIIADSAVRAALLLTDKFVLDRTRPDRAIDALDEACAHTHATARYTPELERLYAESRGARARGASEQPRNGDRQPDDTVERVARDGFDALQRFGAGLEAFFSGGEPEPVVTGETRAAPKPPQADPLSADRRMPAAEESAELQRKLIDAGIVVRGHDVARVVAVSTGREVKWED